MPVDITITTDVVTRETTRGGLMGVIAGTASA